MKKLFFFIILLGMATSVSASIAYVSASGTNCSQNSASVGVTCTAAAATVLGNDVIVGLSWKTTTVSIIKLVGSASKSYFFPYSQNCNSTNSCSAIFICRNCAALTNITPTFTGTTLYELNVAEYSGVSNLGITFVATGTSTTPSLTSTTGDNNNFVVCETSNLGNAGIPTANTGTLRQANRTGTTSGNVAGALIENTVGSAGSVTCSATITSGVWSAAGVELRSVARPKSYIWPDCDTSHPCVIYGRDTPASGQEILGPHFYFDVQPSQANNFTRLVVTHPIAETISSISSTLLSGTSTGDTWVAGPTATGATLKSEYWYICHAATGAAKITITLSGAIAAYDVVQLHYAEISGIKSTPCVDGSSSATAVAAGAMQPGSITPTTNGGLFDTFGIDSTGTPPSYGNNPLSGPMQPDDIAAKWWDSSDDNFGSTIYVQPTAGAFNPTLYVNGMDVNLQNAWQLVSQVLKADSTQGTQPSAGHDWIVKDVFEWSTTGIALNFIAFPTNGNAIFVGTPHYDTLSDLSTLADNYGSTYTRNSTNYSSGQPQQYTSCLGSTVSKPDRILSNCFNSGCSTHYGGASVLRLLDIAGAKSTGGATGCIGNKDNATGTQAAVVNSNIVTSSLSPSWTFTPTLNGSAYSLVLLDTGFGSGPPTGPCVSGGVTPPTCTGNMSTFDAWESIYSESMTDSDHYTTGDVFGYYYTNSASAKSFDFLMANSAGAPAGGTGVQVAATEILGEPVSTAGGAFSGGKSLKGGKAIIK